MIVKDVNPWGKQSVLIHDVGSTSTGDELRSAAADLNPMALATVDDFTFSLRVRWTDDWQSDGDSTGIASDQLGFLRNAPLADAMGPAGPAGAADKGLRPGTVAEKTGISAATSGTIDTIDRPETANRADPGQPGSGADIQGNALAQDTGPEAAAALAASATALTDGDILLGMVSTAFYGKQPMNVTGQTRKVITYQYAGTSAPADSVSPVAYSGWTEFSQQHKDAVRSGLDHIESFLNVSFVEVTGQADPDINLGRVTLPGTVTGQTYTAVASAGDQIHYVDSTVVYDNLYNLQNWPDLVLHEFGHALGLKHPFEQPGALTGEYNSNKYTVMAYNFNPDTGRDVETMQLFDIFALQSIWGTAACNTGDTTYSGSRTSTIDTIWDTGGKDVLNASSRTAAVTLDLREGRFSSIDATDDVVIAYGTVIENAFGGSRDDRIVGNTWKNKLIGNDGNDTLLGGNRNDTLGGGDGNDFLNGQNGNDILWGQNGNDIIKGGAGRDVLYGATGGDKMVGGSGADTFQFRKGSGKDTVADFQDGVDSIQITGLGSEADILAAAVQIGSKVLLRFGDGDVLTIWNTTIDAVMDDILT